MFSRKAAAGLIKPETLPPTEGAAAQHSLRAYLQTRDWMLLQSMSVDHSEYGWTIGFMVLSLFQHYTPWLLELLRFTTYNCHKIVATNGVAARRVASSVSQHVETAKAFHAKIASMIV